MNVEWLSIEVFWEHLPSWLVASATIALAIAAWRARNDWKYEKDLEFRRSMRVKLQEKNEAFHHAWVKYARLDAGLLSDADGRKTVQAYEELMVEVHVLLHHLRWAFVVHRWPRATFDELKAPLINAFKGPDGEPPISETQAAGEVFKKVSCIADALVRDEKGLKRPPTPAEEF